MTAQRSTDFVQRAETAQKYIQALVSPTGETRHQLAGHLADEVKLSGQFGSAVGKEALLAYLADPSQFAGGIEVGERLAKANWTEPEPVNEFRIPDDSYVSKGPTLEGTDSVVIVAHETPRNFVFGFAFDDQGRISEVQVGAWMDPSAKGGIHLTGDLVARIDNAEMDGHPVVVSYIDATGDLHIGVRGSMHVHSPDQLAFWARASVGGIVDAIANNPRVAILYINMNPEDGAYLEIFGRAHAAESEELRNAVYDKINDWEKNWSWERQGEAVIVEVDRVRGTTSHSLVEMEREASA